MYMVYLRKMNVAMVIVSARRDTVTPTIPMISREMVSSSENWRWGGGGGERDYHCVCRGEGEMRG